MPTFFTDLGVDPKAQAAYVVDVKGNVVALLQAGCCAGALLINVFAGTYLHDTPTSISNVTQCLNMPSSKLQIDGDVDSPLSFLLLFSFLAVFFKSLLPIWA